MNKAKSIFFYTLIAYVLIWAVGLTFRLSGTEYVSTVGMLAASCCMLFPLVSTLIVQRVNHEPLLRGLGVCWKVNRWWFVGWLLMPVVAVLTVWVSSWMPGASYTEHSELMNQSLESMNADLAANGGPTLTPKLMLLVTLVSGLLAGCTINALFAFGEEVGWRGYLLKQFEGRPFMLAAVVIGLIWGLWHAPLILLGHNYPQHPVAGVFMMMALCVCLTPIVQYLRVKSGSVIVAAIVHGTLNATIGISQVCIDGFNDLLCGGPGLAGMLVMLTVDVVLFVTDRYITKDHIFTTPVKADELRVKN